MRKDRSRIPGVHVWPAILVASIVLSGCETIVGTTINTANRNFDVQEAARNKEIWNQSVARYKAMADAGNPGGLYYMAVVHAVTHEPDLDGDVHTVKRLYEEAMAKGSNDARVALGRMLIWGNSHPINLNEKYPQELRDPAKGIDLLKAAAKQSCFYVQPLVSRGRCRERQASTPLELWVLYRDGVSYLNVDEERRNACSKEDASCRRSAFVWTKSLAKDAEQAAYWKGEYDKCEPSIRQWNKQTGCE